MEYKDLYQNKTINTINDYENMILVQKERLGEKYGITRADLVRMLLNTRREKDAMEKIVSDQFSRIQCAESLISELTEQIQDLEDTVQTLEDDYDTLERQFIEIGGAEDPAMRG